MAGFSSSLDVDRSTAYNSNWYRLYTEAKAMEEKRMKDELFIKIMQEHHASERNKL